MVNLTVIVVTVCIVVIVVTVCIVVIVVTVCIVVIVVGVVTIVKIGGTVTVVTFHYRLPVITYTICSTGCVGVHGFSSIWGLIAVGLFTLDEQSLSVLGFVPSGGGLFYVSNVSNMCRRYN